MLAPDQEEYNQKMNDSLAVMKRQLRFRTEDDLLEMFNEQDQVSRAAPHPSPAGRLRLIRRLLLQDHSGAIDDRELKGFFASMNIMVRSHLSYVRLANQAEAYASLALQLSEKEVKNAMKDIDEGGDGTIGFQEMLDWMISKGLWHPDKVGLP